MYNITAAFFHFFLFFLLISAVLIIEKSFYLIHIKTSDSSSVPTGLLVNTYEIPSRGTSLKASVTD